MRKLLSAVILMFSILTANSQNAQPPFMKYINHPWVDSVFRTLNTEQKVAQLIWLAAYSNRDLEYEVNLSNLIRKTGIGGLIFFQDDPVKETEMINYFRKISKVPLMIGMDGEWGAGMRLKGVVKFPYQMTLGAIQDDSLIYKMGEAVAYQLGRAGINVNLAPVADVNNNKRNTVINYRSFGENPGRVSVKASLYMKGMQDNGIFAVAKHFPGHGDTETDSHLDLPVIKHSRERLDSIELVPFMALISEGVSGVMPGHLNIPSLDPTQGLPSTLSKPILTGLLKNELGFKGFAISDAMNMGALTKYFPAGEAEARALAAGMDILEYVTDAELTIKTVVDKIRKGEISEADINEKCMKVLAAKYWAGLNRNNEVPAAGLEAELSSPKTIALIRDLYANALTLLKNEDDIIPIKAAENRKIATIAINRKEMTVFQQRLGKYYPADNYFIDPEDTASSNAFLKKAGNYDLVITGIYGLDQRPVTGFGIRPSLNAFLEKLPASNSITVWFGNPYAIEKAPSVNRAGAILLAYQENDFTEDLSAQLIFGGIGAKGTLPVTINQEWVYGTGIKTTPSMRLQFGLPENAGISSQLLERKIDSIAQAGIAARAFPGCEVMVARKGVVVFQKTYGYQTYENRIPVREDDLYDLASVTKVSSTLAGLMLLQSQGKFSPDETLGHYLPYFKNSNKGDIKMREFLTHQAGLTPWIAFWKSTVKADGDFKKRIFDTKYSEKYPLEVAQGLYINKNYHNKIFKKIRKSPLGEKKYVYSDLTFIIAPGIIEQLTGQKWYEFVTDNIYHKIGAYDVGFNPYLKYNLSRIVPTEYDSLFRKQLLHGTVHDEGAAMLGGISGHAGLFATANDLMKLMELYRRMGEYGGNQIISREVMEEYTKVQFPENNNRRGLGFDKPLLNNSEVSEKDAYPAKSASPSSFGHSGYTGTFVWVDPDYEISYVFLCNRVYPTRENNKLSEMNIRSNILQAIYDSIIEK
ncbi:MAG TPA: glycoside hydrolase family 3 N-terminal domain-containing protein [Bacteroidales bacterium]|nr:glycoside hydrolase family 3 N-terminal domain-containing protein [Bacteroidales bacterium]